MVVVYQAGYQLGGTVNKLSASPESHEYQVETFHLPNGASAHSVYAPTTRSTYMAVWFRCGSRYEPLGLLGATHFLEHTLLDLDPAGASGLVATVEALGGEASGVTSKERMALWWRVPAYYTEDVVKLAGQQIVHPTFQAGRFQIEQQVILEELREALSDPQDCIYDLNNQDLWPLDTLGRPTGGTLSTIAGLALEELISFYEERFHAGVLHIVVASPLGTDTIRRLLEASAFASIAERSWSPAGIDTFRSADEKLVGLPSEPNSAHVLLSVQTGGLKESSFILDVFNILMGESTSSLLFRELRSDRGLVYDISSEQLAYSDTGVWRASFSTSPEDAPRVIGLVIELLGGAKERGWSDDEFEWAKRRLTGQLDLRFEHPVAVASWIGRRSVADSDGHDLFSFAQDVASVTLDEMNHITARLLTAEPTITALGLCDSER